MKRMTGFSLAAAMGAALLMSVSLPGLGHAAGFGPVAEVAAHAAPPVEQAQFRGRGGRVAGGRVGGARIAGGRVGGGRIAGGRIGGGRVVGGYRGGYRGNRGANIAAGIAGAAILGGILAGSQGYGYDDPYYYGAPVYAPEPVYEEEVYVRPRRYNRNYNTLPRNPIRDPAGGGLTSGGGP